MTAAAVLTATAALLAFATFAAYQAYRLAHAELTALRAAHGRALELTADDLLRFRTRLHALERAVVALGGTLNRA